MNYADGFVDQILTESASFGPDILEQRRGVATNPDNIEQLLNLFTEHIA